jgi:hypothetical protein
MKEIDEITGQVLSVRIMPVEEVSGVWSDNWMEKIGVISVICGS